MITTKTIRPYIGQTNTELCCILRRILSLCCHIIIFREREENIKLQTIILKLEQDLEATKKKNKDMVRMFCCNFCFNL